MNRVFLSGDTHGELDLDKVTDYFEDMALYDDELSKDDYLIILGDAGILWDGGAQDASVQQTLRDLPVTVLWLDGNHENFDLIDDYPEDIWHGGRVQYIADDIIHLMRGQIYDIGGWTYFVFGGGNSIDKGSRTPGISWWPEEMPSTEEYEEGQQNLEKHGNKVDYILTHTCPEHVAEQMVSYLYPGEETLQRYFDIISETTEFEEWYFAHWHMDEDIGNYHCLWNSIIELE
jgi:hypothetical protein